MERSRNVIFGKHTHMIARKNMRYIILTLEIDEGHLRSKQRSCGSKFKNTLKDTIFGLQTIMIPLNIKSHTILTFKVIKGHQRSKKVK